MSNNPQKPFQRIVVILSGLALLGVMILPMSRSINQSPYPLATSTTNSSQREKLQAIADGYEQVLKREPKNPTALQGLIEAKLQLKDLEGAIIPMEKLVQLFPEEEKLATILKTMKQELEIQKNPSSPVLSNNNSEQP
ncbi:MAG: tetratricopeptide repeat protein [cyanobacterium endosymbiont of Rhopalodia musculus]|uniref:tetratricopeptide repeat protein n=1 Tax=cyanobacterium endosymbiont of Epithemia clementina EcSB TaxID=3034674 RepID=UPI0024819102|nr:tetratricopeptide repeat protein [cyanobacterium endosymbiont of Epithemia clementina EcSB]WGT68268.1 tetratricopeptide repeat protein [cyanobacterium endosymbiont of Epithemia clementina EcSB]